MQETYLKKLIRRATADTQNALGTNPKRMVVVAILTAIAVGMMGYFEGGAAAFAKFEWWLMLLVAELGLFVILFLARLFWAPVVLHREHEQELSRLANESDEHRKSAMDAAEALELEKSTIRDPRTKVVRSELAKARDGFSRIRRRLEKGDASAVDSFYSLDYPTSEYVRCEVPGYRGYADKHPVTNTHTRQVTYQADELARFATICEARVVALEELIEMHS